MPADQGLARFQSPSGVLGVCRPILLEWYTIAVLVSVPFRGFRGLQVAVAELEYSDREMFQSPSGVLGVCRTESQSRQVPFASCFSPLPGF